MLDWAAGKGDEPLAITDQTLTVGPSPKQVMQQQDKKL
jgi:hypothetical protein